MKRLVAIAALTLTLCGCSPDDSAPVDARTSDVFELVVGDCFNSNSAASQVTSIPAVDCASPHQFEIYASSRMDAVAYPGDSRTAADADASCASAFEDFLGESFEKAHADHTFDFTSLYPTSASWDLGDREVLCAITKTDATGTATKTRGSLAGTVDK